MTDIVLQRRELVIGLLCRSVCYLRNGGGGDGEHEIPDKIGNLCSSQNGFQKIVRSSLN